MADVQLGQAWDLCDCLDVDVIEAVAHVDVEFALPGIESSVTQKFQLALDACFSPGLRISGRLYLHGASPEPFGRLDLPVVRIDGAAVGDGQPGTAHAKAAGMLFGACGISEMSLTAVSSPRISRPRAILFDWDNTLVDSWATIHEALNFLMVAMDRPPWTIVETRERVRLSLREAFPGIFEIGRAHV